MNNSVISGNLSYCIYIEQSSSIRITHNNLSAQYANSVFADIVHDLTVSENDFYMCYSSGVTAYYSNNTVVSHNNFIRTGDAVYAVAYTNLTIYANDVLGIGGSALWVAGTRGSSRTYNNVSGEFGGIMLSGTSSDILVQGNTLTDNDYAITAQSISGVVIRDNVVNDSDNAGDWGSYGSRGIGREITSFMRLWNNTMLHCGIVLYGQTLAEYNRHDVSQNNTVNGLPVLYYRNQSGIALNGDAAGQVILANCSQVTLSNLQLLDADVGLQLTFCRNVTVQGCNLSDNSYAQQYMRTNLNVNMSGCVFSNGLYGIISFTSYGSTSNISLYQSLVQGSQYGCHVHVQGD